MTGILDRREQCLGEFVELCLERVIIDGITCRSKLQAGQRQGLPDIVVQIRCDAAAFLILDQG